jgi:hypothetical protein
MPGGPARRLTRTLDAPARCTGWPRLMAVSRTRVAALRGQVDTRINGC